MYVVSQIGNLLEIIFEEVFQNHHIVNVFNLFSRNSIFVVFDSRNQLPRIISYYFVTDSGQVGLLPGEKKLCIMKEPLCSCQISLLFTFHKKKTVKGKTEKLCFTLKWIAFYHSENIEIKNIYICFMF